MTLIAPRLTTAGALMLSLLILGCAVSAPTIRHLQLGTGEGQVAANADHPVIALDAVSLPDYLLREELLLRDSAYSLRYDSTQRWAEPLDLGTQRVLAARLKSLLGTRQIVSFPQAARAPVDWELSVDVYEFEVQGDRAALRAEGRWKYVGTDRRSLGNVTDTLTMVVSFDESLTLPAQDGQSIAGSLSALLWRFAEELAQPMPAQTGGQ